MQKAINEKPTGKFCVYWKSPIGGIPGKARFVEYRDAREAADRRNAELRAAYGSSSASQYEVRRLIGNGWVLIQEAS